MKIAIEAQRLFRKHKHGMDVVALELIRRLQQLDRQNEYFILAARGPDEDCLQDTDNVKKILFNGTNYAEWEQWLLPKMLKKIKPDIVHCTANTAPLRCSVPLILTLHDIIFLESTNFKGSAYQNFGNLYRRFVSPRAIRASEKIITVSAFEKEVIAQKFPETAHKIKVVYNAVSENFNDRYSQETKDSFKKKYSLPQHYILLLGNTAPKKNTSGALKAYELYRSMSADPLPLVVADYQGHSAHSDIVYPGYIPVNEMPLLYNSASLFLYPSLRESFGMPLLEAMACGVPVIASKTSAIPEIAGNAAWFVDPTNYQQIAEAISSMLADDTVMSSYKEKGLARASQFSWDNSAKELLNLYTG